MNKTSVIASLKHGQTVCIGTSRWRVGYDEKRSMLYKVNVLNGESLPINKFTKCFIHTGGVGSDD